MPKARADGPEICCTLLRRAASADVIRRSLKAAQQQITLAQWETCEPWPRPDECAVAAPKAQARRSKSEHCLAKRAALGEAVEELAPPSGSRPKPLLGIGWATIPPRVGGARGRSKRGGKSTLLKLVRSPSSKHKDS
ncbi:hypothetical protein [Sorangium sp. So ce1389]|uniref:hypothetical protein n=1 Tax=Sorangium sp. So ce1389 TaxID=3133336 RepID=UPI003F611157